MIATGFQASQIKCSTLASPIKSSRNWYLPPPPPPISFATRFSWADKYFSGCPGFLCPTNVGRSLYYNLENLPVQATGFTSTTAVAWLYFQLFASRTDVVVGGVYNPSVNLTVHSTIGAGQCPQCDGPDWGAYGGPLYNPDLQWIDQSGAQFGNMLDVAPGTTNTSAAWGDFDDNPILVGTTTSILSSPVDVSGAYAATSGALLSQPFPPSNWTDSNFLGWHMTFKDAPQVVTPNYPVRGLNASSYTSAPVVVTDSTGANDFFRPTGAVACSGWSVNVSGRAFTVFRGQVRNTSTFDGTYWVGRCQGAANSAGGSTLIISVVTASATLKASGTKDSGGNYLDRVECPFVTSNPFPFASIGNYPITGDCFFIVVNQTPAAWAAANGYVLTTGPSTKDASADTTDASTDADTL